MGTGGGGGGGGGVANYMLRLSFRNLREVSKSVVLRRCVLCITI